MIKLHRPSLGPAFLWAILAACADGAVDTTDAASDTFDGVATGDSPFVPPPGAPVTCHGRTCGDDKGNSWTFAEGVVQVGAGTPYEVVSWTRELFVLRPAQGAASLVPGTVLYVVEANRDPYGARVRRVTSSELERAIEVHMEPLGDLNELLAHAAIDITTPLRMSDAVPGAESDDDVLTIIEEGGEDGATIQGPVILISLPVPAQVLPGGGTAMSFTFRCTPSLEFGVDTAKGTFKSIMTLSYTRTASFALKYHGDLDIPLEPLESLPLKSITTMIGYIPFWMDLTLEIGFDLGLEGDVDVSIASVKKGTYRLGVTRTPTSGWQFVRTHTPISDTTTPTIAEESSAEIEASFKLSLVAEVYSMVKAVFTLHFVAIKAEIIAKRLAGDRTAFAFGLSLFNKVEFAIEVSSQLLQQVLDISESEIFKWDKELNKEYLGCWQWGPHLPANSGWKKMCSGPLCQCNKFPDCYQRSCGTNGAGGSCGSCSAPAECVQKVLPPSNEFKSSSCVSPECPVDWCGMDKALNWVQCKCTSDKKCNTTTRQCYVPCIPTCDPDRCGDDNCGGTCKCSDPTRYDCISGICELKRESNCIEGACDNDDGNGQSCPCSSSDTCVDGSCKKKCQTTCAAETDTCIDGVCTCVPGNECDGKPCGVDRCGRACPVQCDDTSEVCHEGACYQCVPKCTDESGAARVCGDDRCGGGGKCGACPAGSTCNADNCPVGSTCAADQLSCVPCAPDCASKVCGDDGCGGTCGICPDDGMCVDGACHVRPTEDTCAGRAPSQLCQATGRDDNFRSLNGKCYCDDYCTIAKDCCADVCTTCGWGCRAGSSGQ